MREEWRRERRGERVLRELPVTGACVCCVRERRVRAGQITAEIDICVLVYEVSALRLKT